MTILTDSAAIETIVRGDDRARRLAMVQEFQSDPVYPAQMAAIRTSFAADEREAASIAPAVVSKPVAQMTDEEINWILYG